MPYELLEPDGHRGESGTALAPPLPERVPVVFWIRGDERLVPSAVETVSCVDGAEAVVRQVLDALTLSPTPEQWTAGLSSAIPSTAQLELMSTDDGVAEIELDPVTLGDPERLPLAVGQLVLSVTSAPGVDGVRLLTSGHIVDVPLPGGALAGRPVTADDYATLLPDRLLVSPHAVPTMSADIGCTSPAP
ncbi:GerMN domain-containing protein [Nocardioides astragali]|uniref:GerMN domain-containing protein n=1 Tax=Nocardioides astragali TaxID=1776736 RepID=A0ABW2N132_9ACTN|nr:GerMN domain-containing protein [Nocardioides astragali]